MWYGLGLTDSGQAHCRVLAGPWWRRCRYWQGCTAREAAAGFPGWVTVNAWAVEGVNAEHPAARWRYRRPVGVTVVWLGAWAELARKDRSGMDIDVHEFAVLDDGRRLVLHQERGFSTSARHMTADHAESSVLTTVLPDDAEVTGEDHPWEWLASLIRTHGVAVTPLQLKTVGYVVEFGPRLAALLESEDQQER